MRRENDFYPTPEFAARELLSHVHIEDSVLECCSGDNAIADALKPRLVCTNDIDPSMPSDFHRDMAIRESWTSTNFEWVVTNPPFSLAAQIVPLAYEFAGARFGAPQGETWRSWWDEQKAVGGFTTWGAKYGNYILYFPAEICYI